MAGVGEFNPFSYTQAAQLDKKIAQTEVKTKTPEIKNDPKIVSTTPSQPITDSKNVKEIKGAELKNKLPEGLFDKSIAKGGYVEPEIATTTKAMGEEGGSKPDLSKIDIPGLKEALKDATTKAPGEEGGSKIDGGKIDFGSLDKPVAKGGYVEPKTSNTTKAMGEEGGSKIDGGKIDLPGLKEALKDATTKAPGEEGGSKIDFPNIDFSSLVTPIIKK